MDPTQFPSNSTSKPESDKKVTQVTTGNVGRRKPPLGRRFLETFVVGNTQNVVQYVFLEVLVPAMKDVITDVATTMVERMLYGETRPSSRRPGSRMASAAHTAYNRMSAPQGAPWNPNRRPTPTSRPTSNSYSFDDIVVATRAEAEEVLTRMDALVEQYGEVSVSDLYGLVGLKDEWTDRRWGWTNLARAGIRRIGTEGYLIDLEKPIALD